MELKSADRSLVSTAIAGIGTADPFINGGGGGGGWFAIGTGGGGGGGEGTFDPRK